MHHVYYMQTDLSPSTLGLRGARSFTTIATTTQSTRPATMADTATPLTVATPGSMETQRPRATYIHWQTMHQTFKTNTVATELLIYTYDKRIWKGLCRMQGLTVKS